MMSCTAKTMFDIIYLATRDTTHLYRAYSEYIRFKSLGPWMLIEATNSKIYHWVIAEHLSVRLLIVQRSQFAFVCMYVPYFTIEAPTCFDSYNQPRLGGGRLFEHAAIELWKRPPKSISTLLPCSCINN